MAADCGVIIVAAGQSTRMGQGNPKQFCPLAGRPLYQWSLEFFARQASVRQIALVVPPPYQDAVREAVSKLPLDTPIHVVGGGLRRQDSVAAGMRTLSTDAQIVAVHDAARPFVPSRFELLCELARTTAAAIFAYPITDTVKRVENEIIQATLDRRHLWAAQTPQVFRRELLQEALAFCAARDVEVTDDAAAVALCGHAVHVLLGERWNIKITEPQDWLVAECLAAGQTFRPFG